MSKVSTKTYQEELEKLLDEIQRFETTFAALKCAYQKELSNDPERLRRQVTKLRGLVIDLFENSIKDKKHIHYLLSTISQ